jgi:hypothetical protein
MKPGDSSIYKESASIFPVSKLFSLDSKYPGPCKTDWTNEFLQKSKTYGTICAGTFTAAAICATGEAKKSR